jgi:putative DNA primase/helicase
MDTSVSSVGLLPKDNQKKSFRRFAMTSHTNGHTSIPPKPQALPVQPDNIPVELRTRHQWVNWRYEYQPERNPRKPWTKPPFQINGNHASSTGPHTWTTFDIALQVIRNFDGLGFAPSEQDPYTFTDLDHCRDPVTGEIASWAQRIVDTLGSYTEVSPSGTGIRIITKGKLPPYGRKKGNVEMYHTGHYLTLTGHHLAGTPREIQERQTEIDTIHAEVFGHQSQPQNYQSGKGPAEHTAPGLSDGEVLSKACTAKNGERVYRLYHLGDTSGYDSDDSAADLALCGLLAFYTGPDTAQLDRLFRGSKLFREKWDRQHYSDGRTYGQGTIEKALEDKTEFYSSHSNGVYAQTKPPIPDEETAQPTWAPSHTEVPTLPDDVWVGWLKKFRDWVLPTTDGAIEGIFAVASMDVGLAIGRDTSIYYFRPTFANFYTTLCGPTGVPKKTTILDRSLNVISWAFAEDFLRVVHTVGSAEGLQERFCREAEEGEGKNKHTVLKPVPGQRVLLNEPEFTGLLKKMRRPGTANITEILLGLFDGSDYTPPTRKKPIVVREPFFSLLTTTTPEALELSLNDIDIDSGLIPRFATFFCTPREPKASAPPPDHTEMVALANGLQDISQFARSLSRTTPTLQLSQQARDEWELIYPGLVKEGRSSPKAVSAIMERVPTMIMKWALVYAIQAGHSVIEVDDLARAVIVGDYLMQTAQLVPQHVEKTFLAKVEGKILEVMSREPSKWWKASLIHQRVSGRTDAATLRRILDSLVALDKLEQGVSGTVAVYRVKA